jgi:hypothetical protein
MSKSSRPSRRRQEQLDSLYWAGRAKQLGLTRQDAVKKAQLEAEALARVTARITQPAATALYTYAAPRQDSKSDFWDAFRYLSSQLTKAPKPLDLTQIRRPRKFGVDLAKGSDFTAVRLYGESANFLILDDLHSLITP